MIEAKFGMKFLPIVISVLLFSGCSSHQSTPLTVVSVSDVQWEPLNPARGDKSPQAATLWGDRNGVAATGFLVKFRDDFSSPPHIHNVSYRGVVLDGLIHNDDPDAAHMWMPKGSYWTQPKGETHITAAKGPTNVAYIEIEEAPYLVRPPKDAFDSGERPVNIDPSNFVWLDSPETPEVKLVFLWGSPKEGQLHGSLVKLPPGFKGSIHNSSTLKVVSVQGHYLHGSSDEGIMGPGSYFSSTEESTHRILCEAAEECIFYVRASGKYAVIAG